MAAYTAIADVGDTLVSLLTNRMEGYVETEMIALATPGDGGAGEDYRLTVYLYDVRQNEHLSNNRANPAADDRTTDAALVLDLHYLITALPNPKKNEGQTSASAEQHSVLGRAMQILETHAIVRTPDLAGGLDRRETLTVTMESRSRSELLDLWGAVSEEPYQPSIPYVVSPVVIDSRTSDRDQRVLEASFEEYAYEPRTDRRVDR